MRFAQRIGSAAEPMVSSELSTPATEVRLAEWNSLTVLARPTPAFAPDAETSKSPRASVQIIGNSILRYGDNQVRLSEEECKFLNPFIRYPDLIMDDRELQACLNPKEHDGLKVTELLLAHEQRQLGIRLIDVLPSKENTFYSSAFRLNPGIQFIEQGDRTHAGPLLSPLESSDAIVQSIVIANTLRRKSIGSKVICNPLGEPLAVVVRNLFDPTDLHDIAVKARVNSTAQVMRSNKDLAAILPVGDISDAVYPSRLLHALDYIVQAATGSKQVRANRLIGSEVGPGLAISGDALPHLDFAMNLDNPLEPTIQGLNVHLTLVGSVAARFGLVRSFADIHHIVALLQETQAAEDYKISLAGSPQEAEILVLNKKRVLAKALGVLCSTLAAPFSEPVTLQAGDAVIFQARQYEGEDLLPVAHLFQSQSTDRISVGFTPGYGTTRRTIKERDKLLQRSGNILNQYGYTVPTNH